MKTKITNSKQYTHKHNGYRLHKLCSIDIDDRKKMKEYGSLINCLRCIICRRAQVQFSIEVRLKYKEIDFLEEKQLFSDYSGQVDICDKLECLEEFRKVLIFMKLTGGKK